MPDVKKSFSLGSHLVLLGLAALIPFFIFSAWIVNQLLDYERSFRERTLLATTAELAKRVEQEIEISIRTLQAVATTENFKNPNLQNLHDNLKKVQSIQSSWVGILLHTRDQRPVLNTFNFKAKLLSPADPQSFAQVVQSGEPVVGTGVLGRPGGPTEGRLAFAVRVPIKENGQVTHVLSALIEASSLQEMVNKTGLETIEEWTRVIVDRNGRIMARSRNPEKFVGKYATASYQAATMEKDQDFREEINLEGHPVYLAFTKSPFSQWSSGVVVPRAVLDTPATKTKILVFGVGAILVFGFGGLAVFYSRKLARSLKSAADGAVQLAKGGEPLVEASSVAELEKLRESMISASRLLQAREKERNELLSQAQEARIEAEKANRSKSYFLANMSHEIRTPLGVTLGLAELFANDEIPAEAREMNLKVMKRNGQLLLTLINDILDLSKAEADKLKIEKSRFHLVEMFSQIIEGFNSQASEKGLLIRLISDESLPQTVETDGVRFGQVIYNIVGNAVKFTQRGEIRIELKVSDEKLVVLIQDSGVGISTEHQKNLFNIFTQGEEGYSRKFGGAGLGLALSKKLMELLGGELSLVGSVQGQGTTFKIVLPLE